MRRLLPFLLPALLVVAGCSKPDPSLASGDERIDYIFEREMGRKALCLTVGPFHMLDHTPGRNEPGVLHPGMFQNREVRELAPRFARGEGEVSEADVSGKGLRPAAEGSACDAWVSRPVTIGDISLVEFSAPSGEVGTYAFKMIGGHWKPVERVRQGYR